MKSLTKAQADARVDRLMGRNSALIKKLLEQADKVRDYQKGVVALGMEDIADRLEQGMWDLEFELISRAHTLVHNDQKLFDAFEEQEKLEKGYGKAGK